MPDTTATVRSRGLARGFGSVFFWPGGFFAGVATVSCTLATLKTYLTEQSRPFAHPSKFAAHFSHSWRPLALIHFYGKPAP